MKKDISLVYMVAGLSSRFGGKIKQFARVGPGGETLIECSLKQALQSGFKKIVFIVGEKTEQPFREMFGGAYRGVKIDYAKQKFDINSRDKPWGTTDALCSAQHILKEPFVVCNGDDLYGTSTFEKIFTHLQKEDSAATVGYVLNEVLPEKGGTSRGIFSVIGGYVTDIEETLNLVRSELAARNLTGQELCSMNIFGLYPSALQLLNKRLTEFKSNHINDRKSECFLPVALAELIKNKNLSMKIYPATDRWFGITNPSDESVVKEALSNSLS